MLHIAKKSGFTFIELLIAVGIIGMALPALFSIMFTVLRQETKIIRLAEIKRQGDYALNAISTNVRNNGISAHTAITPAPVNEVCRAASVAGTSPTPTPASFSYFMDKTDTSGAKYFGYTVSSNRIQATATNGTLDGYLTTSKVKIENFSMKCSRASSYAPPIVEVNFDICYETTTGCLTPPATGEQQAILHYQTNIKLRNQ